ncbi:MAG: hypothetical protein E6R03_07630 [Hyphomicrobiaceae bacterium]|nr:MAG: hypothetical protein E6R03_07630 [Hyphomicrobiaceae bacterium]
MLKIKVKYVLLMLVIIVGGFAAVAYGQDQGDRDAGADVGITIALDQGTALAKLPAAYAVVPVDPLPADESGKLLVPQGTVDNMSDAAVAVTLLRSYKLGEWLLLALLVTQLLIRAMKNQAVTKKIMPAYGTLVVLTLCAISSVLSAIVGGMNPVEAAVIFVLTGAPKWLHDMEVEWRRVKQAASEETV